MLALVLALTVTSACGAKESEETIDQVVQEEIETVVEESTSEYVISEEYDIDEEVEPSVEVSTLSTGELDFDAFQADEEKDHQFGDIGYVAQYRDIRETTGLRSESTEDVWKYLTEDGVVDVENIDDLWEYGASSYTGRWAYPTLLESEATKDLFLYDWTDSYVTYIADEGENNNAVLICTGYDVFNSYTSLESDTEYTFEEFKTFNINGDDIDVYKVSGAEDSITYLYKYGGFSIVLEFVGEDILNEDLLFEVMNDIEF